MNEEHEFSFHLDELRYKNGFEQPCIVCLKKWEMEE